MADTFDDLYEQIIQCERRVEKRQRLQSGLREQVQKCKENLEQVVKEQSQLQNELLIKMQHLSDERMTHVCMEKREKILASQKEVLLEEATSLQQELASVSEELEKELVQFCQTVEEHTPDLDLTVSGPKARQNKAAETLTQLLEEEQTLITEISEYDLHKKNISQLEAERYCLQQSLADLDHNKRELEECVLEGEKKLDQLEEERQSVSKTPNSSQEFKRLRGELAFLSTDSLEQECSNLRQQVYALQQRLHSRQQQQLRQQCQQLPQAAPQVEGAARTPGVASDSARSDGGHEDLNQLNDPFGEDDERATLPDIEMSPGERTDAGDDLFKVCNRQKPVFKPTSV